MYPQPPFLFYHFSQVQLPLPVFKEIIVFIFWINCMLIFNKIKECSKRRAFPVPLSTHPPGCSPKIMMVRGFFWYVQRDWLPTNEDSVRNISTLITLYWINQQIIQKFRMYVPMCASVCIYVWMYILTFYEFIQ